MLAVLSAVTFLVIILLCKHSRSNSLPADNSISAVIARLSPELSNSSRQALPTTATLLAAGSWMQPRHAWQELTQMVTIQQHCRHQCPVSGIALLEACSSGISHELSSEGSQPHIVARLVERAEASEVQLAQAQQELKALKQMATARAAAEGAGTSAAMSAAQVLASAVTWTCMAAELLLGVSSRHLT